jgi:hydroxymethylpyrimidine pyrophosphatase-like HAD family hydrolase
MHFQALATDYDGTLATHGTVGAETINALQRLEASGRKLLLVTGREVPDLKRVFPDVAVFHCVVAENGALLYDPATDREMLLCDPASAALVTRLHAENIPVSVGRGIVATTDRYAERVRIAVEQSGVQLHVLFNKGSVMILPAGVDKASGLLRALESMGIHPENVVGVGDAENDSDFLGVCGCAVAVSNALPALKLRADLLTAGDHGSGVVEIIDQLLADDLARCRLRRGT